MTFSQKPPRSPSIRSARAGLEHHLLAAFVVVTYAWTWGVNLPAALATHGIGHAHISGGALTLAGFAPSIVALVLLAFASGRVAVRDIWLRLVHASAPPAWYALAVLGPIVSVAASLLVLPAVGQPVPQLKPWYNVVLGILFLIPLTGLFEEIGWRGLLLDRLEQRMSPLRASALIAAIWGVWHIPMYLRLMPEGNRTPLLIVLFVISMFPLSVLFTWVYNRTERRLLPMIVLHAAIDASVGYFFARLPQGELRPFMCWCALLWVLAGLVIWKQGRQLGRFAPTKDLQIG
ncbi:MAG: type II CAAX endopeptidase family protein [Gemmatimonadaceae bacterium]